MPFGMLSFSPTSTAGDQTNTGAAGGYQYDTTRIRGFALTHVNGAGCHPGAMGDVPIMPVTTDVTTSPTSDTKDEVDASNFTHANERAVPGRYTLALDNGTRTDFAATMRAGVGTFQFPQGKPANLLFRTSNSLNGSEDADISIDAKNRTITGSVLTGAFCGRWGNGGGSNKRTYYRLHFVAKFDKSFATTGTWANDQVRPGWTSASGGEGYETGANPAGKGSGGWVGFAPGQKVRMQVGISYTSVKAARANLASEVRPTDTVDPVARRGNATWNKQLSRIEVRGADKAHATKFYTALYHTFLQPNVVNDVAGTYWGADQKVHRLAPRQRAQYGNFSGWDEYRARTQMLALLEPRLSEDFAQSLLNNSRAHDGIWDRWIHLTGWTPVMTGDPSAPTLAASTHSACATSRSTRPTTRSAARRPSRTMTTCRPTAARASAPASVLTSMTTCVWATCRTMPATAGAARPRRSRTPWRTTPWLTGASGWAVTGSLRGWPCGQETARTPSTRTPPKSWATSRRATGTVRG